MQGVSRLGVVVGVGVVIAVKPTRSSYPMAPSVRFYPTHRAVNPALWGHRGENSGGNTEHRGTMAKIGVGTSKATAADRLHLQ